jgi:hypothetical protein
MKKVRVSSAKTTAQGWLDTSSASSNKASSNYVGNKRNYISWNQVGNTLYFNTKSITKDMTFTGGGPDKKLRYVGPGGYASITEASTNAPAGTFIYVTNTGTTSTDFICSQDVNLVFAYSLNTATIITTSTIGNPRVCLYGSRPFDLTNGTLTSATFMNYVDMSPIHAVNSNIVSLISVAPTAGSIYTGSTVVSVGIGGAIVHDKGGGSTIANRGNLIILGPGSGVPVVFFSSPVPYLSPSSSGGVTSTYITVQGIPYNGPNYTGRYNTVYIRTPLLSSSTIIPTLLGDSTFTSTIYSTYIEPTGNNHIIRPAGPRVPLIGTYTLMFASMPANSLYLDYSAFRKPTTSLPPTVTTDFGGTPNTTTTMGPAGTAMSLGGWKLAVGSSSTYDVTTSTILAGPLDASNWGTNTTPNIKYSNATLTAVSSPLTNGFTRFNGNPLPVWTSLTDNLDIYSTQTVVLVGV